MKLYLLSLVNLFLLFSCKKYKPAEAAFFIRTPNANVATINNTSVQQGSGSNKITDLFLYVDGKFQGVYPVGNLMPIIHKNSHVTINVFAGIKNNGITDTRIVYPFYDFTTLDTLVESGKTIERPFTFKYGSGVKFEMLEDFEPGNIGLKIVKSPESQIDYKLITSSDRFEGRSLEMSLTGDSVEAQIESTISYPLPTGSANVYLELNYKCTAPFSIGLIGDAGKKDAFIFNPQTTWNKTYIQLSNTVNLVPVSTKYKIYFRMVKTDDYPEARMFLDNIKLLHL